MKERIDEFISEYQGRFHILEQQIDLKEQMAYFDMSKKIRKGAESNGLDREQELWDANVPLEDKKKLLIILASSQEVKAYRVLERFYNECSDEKIKDWSYLALTESRMAIEGALSDEKQIFISTGLGGKLGMLRYFIVLFPHNHDKGFSEFETEFIQKEFQFIMETSKCEWELNETRSDFISFLVLIPLEVQLKELILKVFEAANQLDDYVSEKFIITNVKIMDEEEIFDFYENGDDEEDVKEIELD